MPETNAALRKTKIVCTIGPATSSESQLERLINAGMNVARLNFSHGTQDDHRLVIERLRLLSGRLGIPIAILQDLAGPKVRIGTFGSDSIELRPGDSFTLTTREIEGTQDAVSVSYPELHREVQAGDKLLLADGTIRLEVTEVDGRDIRCRVEYGGRLSSRKGVNCPSGLHGLPILQDKDLDDLRFGVTQQVDYVGLSFVRTAEDIEIAKREIAKRGSAIPIIAKIETQSAVDHFGEIADRADGIMIARGDLSIETPFTRVPVLQKTLICKTNNLAKPVITATQMLWSMVQFPQPTRAEVADVANAIMDGSDGVMLSDETTVGLYPIRAVETMAAIAGVTEAASMRIGGLAAEFQAKDQGRNRDLDALAKVACELADKLSSDVIATITRSGRTARFASKYRPQQPILAATPQVSTYRQLALVRGVIPLLIPDYKTVEEAMAHAAEAAQKEGWGNKRTVFLSDTNVQRGVF